MLLWNSVPLAKYCHNFKEHKTTEMKRSDLPNHCECYYFAFSICQLNICFIHFFGRNKETQNQERAHNNKKQDLSKQHYVHDDGYSTIQDSSLSQGLANECSFKHPTLPTLLWRTGPSALAKPQTDVKDKYSMAQDDLPGLVRPNIPSLSEVSISPYACFYGTRNAVTKAGWLDKLSPQG